MGIFLIKKNSLFYMNSDTECAILTGFDVKLSHCQMLLLYAENMRAHLREGAERGITSNSFGASRAKSKYIRITPSIIADDKEYRYHDTLSLMMSELE